MTYNDEKIQWVKINLEIIQMMEYHTGIFKQLL